MIYGDLAIVLNLLSVAVLSFVVSIAVITVASHPLLSRLHKLTLTVRRTVLWILNTLPWWVALGCVLFYWPREINYFTSPWLNEFAHWHHIDMFSYTSWHSVTLMCALGYFCWSFVSTWRLRYKQMSSMTSLINLASVEENKSTEQPFHCLNLSAPTAFTTGFLTPKVYISTALKKHLSDQELSIILRHEMAHVEAKDPLFKVIFSALAAFYPAFIARHLVVQYTLLTEQVADAKTAQQYDTLDIAQTLINVARIQRSLEQDSKALPISYFGNDQTTARVQNLITPVLSSSQLTIALTLGLVVIAALLTTSVVDSLHHFIETIFTH